MWRESFFLKTEDSLQILITVWNFQTDFATPTHPNLVSNFTSLVPFFSWKFLFHTRKQGMLAVAWARQMISPLCVQLCVSSLPILEQAIFCAGFIRVVLCIHAEKHVICLRIWRSLNSVIVHQLLFLGSTYSGPVGETPNSLSELNSVRSSLEIFLTSGSLRVFYYAWAGLRRPTSLL